MQFTGGLAFATSSGGFTITVTNVTLSLGGSLAVATGVDGTVVVTSSGQTPVLTPTLTAANLAVNVPGFMINGPISFSGATGGSLTVTLGTSGVSGTPATVTVAQQSLTGVFSITVSGSQLAVSATGVALNIGPTTMPATTPYVAITGASGQLLLSSAGVAADINLSSVTLNLPGFAPVGPFSGQIEINSQSIPVSQTFAGSNSPLALPAGPFVEASISIPNQTAVGSPAVGYLSGTFGFEQQTVGSLQPVRGRALGPDRVGRLLAEREPRPSRTARAPSCSPRPVSPATFRAR